MKRILFFALIVIVSGCASHQRLATQSGGPEAVFLGCQIEDVKGKIANGCASNGLNIYDMSSNQVIAGKQLQGGEAVAMQFLVGNAYSTPPVRKVQFLIFQHGENVKVTAREWVETQTAYGQGRQVQLNSTEQMTSLQSFLRSIGGT